MFFLPASISPVSFHGQRIGCCAILIGRLSGLDLTLPENCFQQAMAANGELLSATARPAKP